MTFASNFAMRGASMFQLLTHEAPWLLSHLSVQPSAGPALTECLTVYVAIDDQTDWARAFRALLMPPSSQSQRVLAARRALCSMLYALLKGAASRSSSPENLTVSTAKFSALAYEQVRRRAAHAGNITL